MVGILRYPASNDFATFIDSADPVYGTGSDGNITLDGTTTVLGMVPSSSVYSMTQDLYFNNLTLNSGVRLAPNGYRIFVKNLLTLNSSSIIGFTTGYSTSGSIYQGRSSSNCSYSLFRRKCYRLLRNSTNSSFGRNSMVDNS